MLISTETQTYIDAVNRFSGNALKHPEDCARLVEASRQQAMEAVLADLCFTAKFLHKTYALMQRLGPLGDGAEHLSTEFQSNLHTASNLMTTLADAMPDEDRMHCVQTYCSLSGPALGMLMELVHDLNWMKNYSLDHKART